MKIFLFYFEMAIKITGSSQNYRVGRVSGNTPIFFKALLCLTECPVSRSMATYVNTKNCF